MKNTRMFSALITVGILAVGCASEKNRPLAQRGWIGGEYALSQRSSFMTQLYRGPGVSDNLPKPAAQTWQAAIKVMHLSTNAPAAMAGLCEDDLIVELNHQPVTSLATFRRTIDRSQPGSVVALKVWREGKSMECNVPVGREKYRTGGYLTIVAPTVVHRWDLWPNPGFSLIFIGYEPDPGLRYDVVDKSKRYQVYDKDWEAYLIFMEVSKGERVESQEPVAVGQGG